MLGFYGFCLLLRLLDTIYKTLICFLDDFELFYAASLKYDHVKADCFACAVLSHGDQTWVEKEYSRMRVKERQDLLFGVDGVSVPTRLVLEWFNDDNCPGLQGKPRLFFFQVSLPFSLYNCKGSLKDYFLQSEYTIVTRPYFNIADLILYSVFKK